jgi:hypothetical protein
VAQHVNSVSMASNMFCTDIAGGAPSQLNLSDVVVLPDL